MERHAVIVGGGIAGLAVGRALRTIGWRIDIHERSAALPESGTALGMWPEALRALDALGIGSQVRLEGVPQRGARLLRPNGRAFARITPQEPAYLISRPSLQRMLHEGLEDAISWNSIVTQPGTFADADLVIGADGIHSAIRSLVAGRPCPPRALGTVALRGVVPGHVDSVTETWGRGRLFGITPQDGHTTNWFASARREMMARRDDGGDLEALRRLFAGWHPAVADVIDRIQPESIDRRDLHDIAPLRTFSRGNLVVVGDAAHAMAPNAGRGACEALLDAVALAEALSAASTVAEGLHAFDTARRRSSQRVVRMSRLMNRLSTADRWLGARTTLVGAAARLAPL